MSLVDDKENIVSLVYANSIRLVCDLANMMLCIPYGVEHVRHIVKLVSRAATTDDVVYRCGSLGVGIPVLIFTSVMNKV